MTKTEPKSSEKKIILDTLDQHGFKFEYEVANVINELHEEPGSGASLCFESPSIGELYTTENEILESDVSVKFSFSNESCEGMCYIECKGSSSDTALFLIDSPKKVYDNFSRCRLPIKANVRQNNQLEIVCDRFSLPNQYIDPEIFVTQNGGFFKKKNR